MSDSPFHDPIERLEHARNRLKDMLKETSKTYGRKVSRRPAFCACFWSASSIALIVVGAIAFPPTIETDFDSFLVTDVESSIRRSAFKRAQSAQDSLSRRLDSAHRVQDSLPRRLDSATVFTNKDLFITYELKHDLKDGLFDSYAIEKLLAFEDELCSLTAWRELCDSVDESKRGFCNPGISALRYFLPTVQVSDGLSVIPESLVLDGKGYDMLPVQPALALLESHKLVDLTLPEDNYSSDSNANPSPTVLRSVFRFAIPCGHSSDSAEVLAKCAAGKERWKAFFFRIQPFLAKPYLVMTDDVQEEEVELFKVWFSGSDIDDFEVMQALSGDFWYAIGSLLLVHVYVLIHTRSFLLCFSGPVISLMAVPLTYVLCAMCFGATQISFASFLALFLVVGFGADVVFVYTDFWRQSMEKAKLETDSDRIVWTYGVAAKASLATTATTALSFLANLASAIRALRQFAVFMGFCVLVTWALISLIYLPLCVIDDRSCSWCRLCSHQRLSFFSPWARHLRKWRCAYIWVTVLFCGIGTGIAVGQLKMNTSVSLFPEGHNQNDGKRVASMFKGGGDELAKLMLPPAPNESVCGGIVGSKDDGAPQCVMNWCEAKVRSAPGNCSAAGKETGGPAGGQCDGSVKRVEVDMLFMGTQSLTRLAAQVALTEFYQHRFGNGYRGEIDDPVMWEHQPQQLLNEWESGAMEIQQVLVAQGRLWKTPNGGSGTCKWQVAVWCGGTLECAHDQTWSRLPNVPVKTSSSTARRLIAQTVPSSLPRPRRAKVRAVFGLWVPYSVGLLESKDPSDQWKFLGDVEGSIFRMQDPWTQRNLNLFCDGITENLQVVQFWCWMQDFKTFSRQKYGAFPVRAAEFDNFALEFTYSSAVTAGTDYIWFINGELKAMFFSFAVNMDRGTTDYDAVLELKGHWDEYFERWNDTAKPVARGGFHVSELWVNAEASSILIQNTVWTLLILLILAFCGMLAFTWSFILSLYVVLATAMVMGGLTFLIIVVMGWEVGLIEVIAIIYFVGYAVTYSLHVAHKYSASDGKKGDAEDDDFSLSLPTERDSTRYMRTVYSLRAIGGAATGSAMTTIGASFFLTFCTLTIFTKLGGMCLAVSILSLLVALGPLPALLLAAGPMHPGSCSRGRGSCLLRLFDPTGDSGASAPQRHGTRE